MTTPLGRRIKEAREAAGLSQAAVGAACTPPVSGQAVYKWEKGKAQPRAADLYMIARLTNRSVPWFLTGVELNPNIGNLGNDNGPGRVVQSVEYSFINNYVSGNNPGTGATVRSSFPCSDKAFQTIIEDDANSPDIQTGDSIIIDPERAPKPGKLVLVLHEGSPAVGRYRPRKDHIEIAPMNSEWPTLHVEFDALIGSVTEITRPQ
jgi:transcriptional regulator with XRE-family HTH domain